MCGIYMTNIPYKKEEVINNLLSINFRGPDNVGYNKIDDISLGHVRLSILDLDVRSNQPFNFENFTIVYNGEIYNFVDIKEELLVLGYTFETTSDTEVLLKGFSAWGKDILPKLNGMFAFAIYDVERQSVFCARDRLGVKPFYYYWRVGEFEICSQLAPLVKEKSKVSDEAVSIYLDSGYIPSPLSILEDVFKLSPGNYMEFDLKKKTRNIVEYWNLKKVETREISYENAKKVLHDLLKDAVKIRMRADVPLGSFLSGGVDSALISSIASKYSKDPINTFTIGFEDPKYDESKVARKFAQIIGTNHTEIICKAEDGIKMLEKLIKVYDEPFADSSALPSLLLNSVTKQYVTVALSGDGGDESFLGYEHFDLLAKFIKLSKIPFVFRKVLAKFNLYKIFGGRPETLKGILKTKDSNDFSWNNFNGFDTLQLTKKRGWYKYYQNYKYLAQSSFQRLADLNIKLWLENDSNVKVDRASMAFGMEIRSPFLDYRIIEFARNLPVEFRYKKKYKKRILKDILEEYIPKEIFNLPKKGFSIPLGEWLRNELKEEITNTINQEFLNSVPNLNVISFQKKMKMHMDGKYDYSFEIWKIFILAKWYTKLKLNKNLNNL